MIFEGPIIEWCDIREAWGESRIVAVGEADGIVVTLVYTDRDDTAPHIGALRANEGTQIVAIPHKSLKEIRASKPKVDRAKIRATTESAIRRHMIEDGEDSDIELETRDVFAPAVLRKRLDMTQEQFARALRITVATLRNWEQGRNALDPAARSLLIVVARDPDAALAALASDAA